MPDLSTLFGRSHDVTVAQECARAVLILLYGLFLVRIAGRRVFGKWSALDIIVSIIIGSNLSRAITGTAPLFGTLAASTLLMALHWVLAWSAARWRFMSRLLEGWPVDLVRDGESRHATRIWHGVSEADINEVLREKGIADPAQVVRLTLEPSGKITVEQ